MASQEIDLGPVTRIPFGEGRVFDVAGRKVAVFRTRAGGVHATEAFCPHRQGPLADGFVGGGRVVCPLHAFHFDLQTGAPVGHNCRSLVTYEVRVAESGSLLLADPGSIGAGGVSDTRLADFGGARVAILEARMGPEVERLVRRFGGEPVLAKALRESPVAAGAAVGAAIDRLSAEESSIIVFQTGVGVDALFDDAEKIGRGSALREALERAFIVSRGPKPAAALAKRGLRSSVAVALPYTTAELLEALEALPLAGASVTLVHYGEANVPLRLALEDHGARVSDLLLYEWLLPADTAPLERLILELLQGTIDVVAFTSQVQIRHLFVVAGESRRVALTAALGRTIVGAIGPTCAAAVGASAVPVSVMPQNPKLGPLFKALAEAVAERKALTTRLASGCGLSAMLLGFA